MYIDLRVEKVETGIAAYRALVIEIKGFIGPSPVHLLENALGQYELYRTYMAALGRTESLYLAISKETYKTLFGRESFKIIVEQRRLALVVIDTDENEVIEWIN